MNLALFKPFRDMTAFDRAFNAYFDSPAMHNQDVVMTPRVDVYENEGDLVVQAELPGVLKDQIKVDVEGQVLTIKAEKKAEHEVKNKDYYFGERSFGKYERSFKLNDTVDTSSVQAAYQDGVLKVSMKRKPEASPRNIEIQ